MAGQVMYCSCMMWELADHIANCSDHVCSKCWLLKELWPRVDELESELQTQRHIREGEKCLDAVFQEAVTLVRVRDISDQLERILERVGEDPVVVHIGANSIGKTRKEN
eukprot:g29636.t1